MRSKPAAGAPWSFPAALESGLLTMETHMTTTRMDTLLCGLLTIVLAALLIHGAAFAGGLTFGREKLKATSKTTGDFDLTNRPSMTADGLVPTFPKLP